MCLGSHYQSEGVQDILPFDDLRNFQTVKMPKKCQFHIALYLATANCLIIPYLQVNMSCSSIRPQKISSFLFEQLIFKTCGALPPNFWVLLTSALSLGPYPGVAASCGYYLFHLGVPIYPFQFSNSFLNNQTYHILSC